MQLPSWLDQQLVRRCQTSFETGEFENAIFAAMKVFEGRVAELLGKQGEIVGVQLIDALLAPEKGKLQLYSQQSEQQGVHQTARGLLMWLRNPSGHRFVEYGPEQAFELICFINFLLGVLRQTVRSQKTVRVVGSAIDRYILADLDGDGIEEKLIVTMPGGGENRQGQLLVLDPVGSDYRKIVLLKDFPEFSLYFLEVRDLNSDGTLEIIASTPAGAHGERMHIFRWDGKSYICIGEFGSDAPSITIEDMDHDGVDEVMVKQRDYETDPLSNSVHQVFHWIEGRYQLVQETKVSGN